MQKQGVRYFAMTVVMADHMAPGCDQRSYRCEALERLIEAVEHDALERRVCRDIDVIAATRLRAW